MSRIALLFTIFSLLFFAACEKDTTKTDKDIVTDDDTIVIDDDLLGDEEPDADTDGEKPTCKLEDSFFDAMPTEWTAFFTMKMSGLINDPNNEDPDFAFLTKIGATLKGEEYNLGDNYGMYMLDSVTTTDGTTMPAVLAVGVGNLTWPVTNKLASLWAGQTFVVVDDLMNWKEQAELEGQTGVSVDGTYQVAIFEVWIGIVGSAQTTRMECIRGLSAMNADESAYDGAMFACVDTNTEWAIGEQMKMMDYSKMLDGETELLAAMNEGLETSDPNYRTDVCRCWAADGTTIMDCEDMKDEFGVGELPDEETDDGEVTDTIDTDDQPDTTDTTDTTDASDIIDTDDDSIETEDDLIGDDDIIITTPCTPNPCAAFSHSNGVCTIDGEGFTCGCDTDYLWNTVGAPGCINEMLVSCDIDNANPLNSHDVVTDVLVAYTTANGWTLPADCAWACDTDFAPEGGSCIGSQEVSCDTDNASPLNSTDVVVDVTIYYTTDGGWELPADCLWDCNTGFTNEGGLCINSKEVNCTNIPTNAHGTGIYADGTITQTWNNTAWEPAADTCTWDCNENYAPEGGLCINSKEVTCDIDNANPLNSTDIIADVTVTYTDLDGWTLPADCLWDCDTDYAPEGGSCINSKEVSCDIDNNSPANSSDTIVDVTVTYTDLGGWTLPADCLWTCNLDYAPEGGLCINSKEVPCDTQHVIPLNSHDVIADVTVTYTTTYGWTPAAECAWACNDHYVKNGEVCDPATQPAPCTNIPVNGHGTGANSEGTFTQTWDGTDWAPLTFTCTWACDATFHQDGLLCVSDTRNTACTNGLPANASWTASGNYVGDGTVNQSWDSGTSTYLPATNTCLWTCNSTYHQEGPNTCVLDTRRVNCANPLPANAQWIAPNADGKFEQNWDSGTSSWLPDTFECVWACNATFHQEGPNTCASDTRNTACTNGLPTNASWTASGNYVGDGTVNQSWDSGTSTYLPPVDECPWACNATFHQEGVNTCLPDTRRVDCTTILPGNAHWIDPNADAKFEQNWDSGTSSYLPLTFACSWLCDTDYHQVGDDTCETNFINSACTNLPLPDNALWADTGEYPGDGTVNRTWDGDTSTYLPATDTCPWICDTGYHKEGNACASDARNVDCTNDLPTNASWTVSGDYVGDGTVDQLWDGDSYEPPADICPWACDNGYLVNETGNGCDFLPILYVKGDATGANNGSSWTDAFTSLSDALRFAIATEEIWVAAGTYHTDFCPSSEGECADPRFRSFWFVPGVSIYGGFAGTETVRGDRDWVANETILSADINDDDVWDDVSKTWLNRTDNTYHVFARGGGVALASPDHLDGFTITGGQADLNDMGHASGAGIGFGDEYPLTIANCTFIGNVAIDGGGAIHAWQTFLSVENCVFDRNIAKSGGAISASNVLNVTGSVFNDNASSTEAGAISIQGTLVLTGSDFNRNYAATSGAAISGGEGNMLTIDDCIFDQNSAAGDKDNINIVRIGANSTVIVTASLFTGNVGTALSVKQSTVTVTDTLFENNSAVNGAAITANNNNSLVIEGCRFIGNQATRSAAGLVNFGGAIFVNGLTEPPALAIIPGLTATISNSVFKDNKAGWYGGAIAILGYPDLIVSNCTMEGNEANPNKDATPDPNAITFGSSVGAEFNNSIIWDPIIMIPAGFAGMPIIASNPIFSYSDVFGCGGSSAWVASCGTDGGNNIDADPLFDATNVSDPLSLQATSPCVDTGSDLLIPVGITTDILGADRIQGTKVDMGAYEQ